MEYKQKSGMIFDRYSLMLSMLHSEEKPPKLVLDIGCGNGFFSSFLVREGYEVIGLDVNERALRIARMKLNRLFTPVIADAQHLPFRKKLFDVIILSMVLEHLQSPTLCLMNVNSVLKDSGIVIISIPSALLWTLLMDKIPLVFRNLINRLKGKERQKSEHISVPTYGRLRKILSNTGLRASKVMPREGVGLSMVISALFRKFKREISHCYPKLFANMFNNEVKLSLYLPKQLWWGWILLCRKKMN